VRRTDGAADPVDHPGHVHHHRGAQGVSAFYGALAGIATVGGPIIGALLISSNAYGYGWRTIFLITCRWRSPR